VAGIGAVVTGNAVAKPALYGLLSPAVTVVEDSTPYWVNGFEYEALECTTDVQIYPVCTNGDAVDVITAASDTFTRSYFPFSIRTSFKASPISLRHEEIEERAEWALDACRQKTIEHELWTGELAQAEAVSYGSGYPNRYLASTDATDLTPSAGVGVKAKYALALLERALADCGCGSQGLIHATRDVATTLAPKNEDGVLLTPLGNKIIAGSGYTGSAPDGTPASGTEIWMYATGPVTVRLGPVELVPGAVKSQATDTSVNTVEYFVEQAAAATWNSCCHFAVLVDLSLDYA